MKLITCFNKKYENLTDDIRMGRYALLHHAVESRSRSWKPESVSPIRVLLEALWLCIINIIEPESSEDLKSLHLRNIR